MFTFSPRSTLYFPLTLYKSIHTSSYTQYECSHIFVTTWSLHTYKPPHQAATSDIPPLPIGASFGPPHIYFISSAIPSWTKCICATQLPFALPTAPSRSSSLTLNYAIAITLATLWSSTSPRLAAAAPIVFVLLNAGGPWTRLEDPLPVAGCVQLPHVVSLSSQCPGP